MPSVLKTIGVALVVGVIAGGALVASIPSPAAAATTSRPATIRYVVDGDTVRLLDGRYVRVGRTDVGRRLVASGYGHARYDSRDGYDWHPLEALYHRIDAAGRNLWRLP